MPDQFWVGQQNREMFCLWLEAQVNMAKYHATCADTYWRDLYKKVLGQINATPANWLPSDTLADVMYGTFLQNIMPLSNESHHPCTIGNHQPMSVCMACKDKCPL